MLKNTKFFWLAAFSAVAFIALLNIIYRPLFPVDETRYLTVAWEMFSKQNWLLPTLNFEPYHHKPPLLFWLIMGLWSVFGVSQHVAMLAPFLIFMGLLGAVLYLTRSLASDNKTLQKTSILLVIGCFPLLLYSNLILFDLFLSIFVLIGIASIWNFARTAHIKYLLIFALCIGLGTLTKGPVILLNLLFPVFLLPLWLPSEKRIVSTRHWIIGFFSATIMGALIALSWAIPAAFKGGPEFTNKIFWGQTAGRIGNSFDHARPFWWYIPLLPLMLCPWILLPSFSRSMKQWSVTKTLFPSHVLSFLLCWIIPTFIAFSMISGKQIHYLFPMLIGCLIIMSFIFSAVKLPEEKNNIGLAGGVILFLILLPTLLKTYALELAEHFNRHLLDDVLLAMPIHISLIGASIFCGLLLYAYKKSEFIKITALSAGMIIFMAVFHVEASNGFYKNYDLRPMAKVIENYKERPMAFLRNYHGEWGFLASLDHPVKQIGPENLPVWFAENPNGIAFIRTSKEEEFRGLYDVIFEMPYKMNNTYAILVPRGKGRFFVRPQQ